jgi:hypothetical protein
MADKEVKRLSRHDNLELYLVARSEEFACQCEAVVGGKDSLSRHFKEVKSYSFDPKDARPEFLFKSARGQTVSQALVFSSDALVFRLEQ